MKAGGETVVELKKNPDGIWTMGDFSFHPVKKEHLKQLYDWRTSDRIASKMLTDHHITWEEHLAWYEKYSKYDPPVNFVVYYKEWPVGYFGATLYDKETDTYRYGGDYIGDTEHAPVETGSYIAYFANDYGYNVLGIDKGRTCVFEFNKRVLRFNKLFGAHIVDELTEYVEKDGKKQKLYYLEQTRDEWNAHKKDILRLL